MYLLNLYRYIYVHAYVITYKCSQAHTQSHTNAYPLQVVANDYARRLQAGRNTANTALDGWFSSLLGVTPAMAPPGGWVACELANASMCSVTETAQASAVLLYNAGSQPLPAQPVRLPVLVSPSGGIASWSVLGADGTTHIAAQLVPQAPADVSLRTQYYGVTSLNMTWLAFVAPPLPAVGYSVVFLQPVSAAHDAPLTSHSIVRAVELGAGGTLTNGILTITFDANNLMSSVASTSPSGLPSVALSQSFLYYNSSNGDATNGQNRCVQQPT